MHNVNNYCIAVKECGDDIVFLKENHQGRRGQKLRYPGGKACRGAGYGQLTGQRKL